MDFYEVVDQVIDLLRSRGQVTYQALRRSSSASKLTTPCCSRLHHTPQSTKGRTTLTRSSTFWTVQLTRQDSTHPCPRLQ
jgi:hypothetical protein